MPGQNPDSSDARRVELAVSQCKTLSILPAVAARFFTQLGRMELTPSSLAELIESDPALTVLVLRLCQDKRIAIKPRCAGGPWIQQVLEGLSLREIRDAVLSAKICGGLSEDSSTDFRTELTRHSLAVACCAEKLAKLVSPPLDGSTAYLAGLLHDIGKFLLDEAMPKSFDTLLEQARSSKTSFCKVEQANLGLDHAILGKRFAQKLQLPGDVILGIWLHHSQTGAISQAVPQARIAAVVELADAIVRRAGIGESGSYDSDFASVCAFATPDRCATPDNEDVATEAIAGSLALRPEQIMQVEQQLPELVRQKSEVAGLALLKPAWAYCDALRATAGQLAGESAKLFDESTQLQSNASHFDFIRELLPKINSNLAPVELAADFAVAWQRFYQTGPVCVYLVGTAGARVVEAVVVENQAKAKAIVLDVPADATLIPQPVCDKFAVLDAADYADWLFEQVDVEFNLTNTRMAPLQASGRTVGIIVFELRHPAKDGLEQRLEPAARLGGVAIDMLEAIGRQQWYAERFARLLSYGVLTDSGQQRVSGNQDIRESGGGQTLLRPLGYAGQAANSGQLAEMAAGAAHEMNNPLSVIRGRAQLLAKSETDADRKRILEQIQQNAGELSAIIDDLMSYANPEKPRPTETAVRQIIDEAADLVRQKKGTSQLDIKIDVPPEAPNVFVDSAQIACAIANLICNGLESYESGSTDKDPTSLEELRRAGIRGQAGPITIKAAADKIKGNVTIQVIDSGRGMDEQTLAKATQPFFSNKPAGRKRGMGLAHAQRLIEINNGTLILNSHSGEGTTVTVTLPCK
jgi:putative nucleotidyltransferase with HDIG domain